MASMMLATIRVTSYLGVRKKDRKQAQEAKPRINESENKTCTEQKSHSLSFFSLCLLIRNCSKKAGLLAVASPLWAPVRGAGGLE